MGRRARDGKETEGARRQAREREEEGGGSRLTEYVFELSGECPSFRERGWVHGL